MLNKFMEIAVLPDHSHALLVIIKVFKFTILGVS